MEHIKVLVVEDDPDSQKLIEKNLNKFGYRISNIVDSGEEAIKSVENDPPDIILMDILLKGVMDGIDTTKIVTSQFNIPVIYLTSYTDEGKLEKARLTEPCGYMIKPFKKEELNINIKMALHKHNLNTALKKYASEMKELANEKTEQLNHANRLVSIGILAAGIAHELNNPINYIKCNIEIMATLWNQHLVDAVEKINETGGDKKLSFALNEFPRMLATMKTGTVRMVELVRYINNYSRKNETVFAKGNIRECVENAINFCKLDLFLKNNINVDLNIAEGIPDIIMNKSEIEQIIVNLFNNAGHAMEEINHEKKRTINVAADHVGDEVIIKIADNGIGMNQKTLNSIFNPFFTTKKVGKGTGLGLSICQELIAKHKGTIMASSEEGEGTTVTIALPLDCLKQ